MPCFQKIKKYFLLAILILSGLRCSIIFYDSIDATNELSKSNSSEGEISIVFNFKDECVSPDCEVSLFVILNREGENYGHTYKGKVPSDGRVKFKVSAGKYDFHLRVKYLKKIGLFLHKVGGMSYILDSDFLYNNGESIEIKKDSKFNISVIFEDDPKFNIYQTVYDIFIPLPFVNFVFGQFIKYTVSLKAESNYE